MPILPESVLCNPSLHRRLRMILRFFPDHTRPGFNLDAPCPVHGWPNMIIHASTTDVEYPEHDGTLSIKCAFGGSETYEVDGERMKVDDEGYLILNRGRRYSSFIHSPTDVETFCIFFRPDFAHSVLHSLSTSHGGLLDDPFGLTDRPIEFIEHVRRHDRELTPLLMELRAATARRTLDEMQLEEKFHELLEAMLLVHKNVCSEIDRIPSARHSTRIELYRRLSQAREFIDDNIGNPITLQEIATVACLSPHHFLRLFKKTFQETPHQYLTRRRIEHAQHLLVTTEHSIGEICARIGFQSPGSFSWLFRRRVGESPDAYRTRHGNGSRRSRNAR